MPYRYLLCRCLPPRMSSVIFGLDGKDAALLQEIRVYSGRPAEFNIGGRTVLTDMMMCSEEMDALLAALSGHALYRCERQMAQGYIPLPGGHRAGVSGYMTVQQDGSLRMGGVTSVCIRICRSVPGASASIRPYLLDMDGIPRRVLLLGAPGCGKTTVLRDAALWLSEEKGFRVSIADEREELFAQAEQGKRLDVLSGVSKAQAFSMLIRSMAPQIIISDEIGREADMTAIHDAARCGVGLVLSAHAGSMREAKVRPVLRELMESRAFDRYILLGRYGCAIGVYGEDGQPLKPEECEHGQLGCSRDSYDRDQYHRLYAVGR